MALAVHHSSRGRYPQELSELVEAGLIERDALRFPWHEDYFYALDDEGYMLLPPVY